MPYSNEEILLINKTTTDFYKSVADSFSDTRQHEWDGWKKCLSYFQNGDTVLDLGCGNRRFSKFLLANDINCHIDNFDNFAWDNKVEQIDIVKCLLEDNLNLKSYDVAVCFGVIHHIPSHKLRYRLIEELSKSKIAIISFWQFSKSERLFAKAVQTTKIAFDKLGLQELEENDYFLGWQDQKDVFRFCHNFTDKEIQDLKGNFNTAWQFISDGKSQLNHYLIINNNHTV